MPEIRAAYTCASYVPEGCIQVRERESKCFLHESWGKNKAYQERTEVRYMGVILHFIIVSEQVSLIM